MKKNILTISYILIPIVFILVGWFGNTTYNLYTNSFTRRVKETPKPTPLSKYTIENLSNARVSPTQIVIGDIIKTFGKFTQRKFYIEFDPTLSNGPTKKVSGVINIPNSLTADSNQSTAPVIIMLRGYIDPKQYYMGAGTQPAASVFATNGYITIAPDFLGYGESDKEATDIFESRFQTYTTAIKTINSIKTVKQWDTKNIFIWAHSNGGQIALTTLEATGVNYPTVLWAPVSKPFPYSILYYTDDASDSGKFLRQKTSEFENVYDSDLFSLTKYLNRIKAPIQLNQGTIDEAVPLVWSDNLSKIFLNLDLDLNYIRYPGNDHNMRPHWSDAVENNLQFFQKNLK
jgi:dipeptidyl aminopeptidase/acylaminoacyl peptidase